jgi:nicotinamide mononucleotide transporter
VSVLEIFANVFNLLSVWLAARNSVLTWPTGIVGCVLLGAMFFEARLYADVTLQVFFVATCLRGWWNWKRGGAAHAGLPISRISRRALWGVFAACVFGASVYAELLRRTTDAALPYADSVILSFSVAAQILMVKRKIENWAFWLVVNTVAVPVYFAKDLKLTGVIYAAFLLNTGYGAWVWSRESMGHWDGREKV